jgi:hypothetical protein
MFEAFYRLNCLIYIFFLLQYLSIFFFLLQWLLLRYAKFNLEVIQAAIKIAKQEGLLVSMDLASFEVYLYVYKFFYCGSRC